MNTWFQAVAELRSTRQAGVLVTVAKVRGHAPRRPGTKMVVSAAQSWGTIGGGPLEEQAIRRARVMVTSAVDAPETLHEQLSDKAASGLGVQCCGGDVTLLLEPLPVVPSVAVFGLGHVGLEIARILSRHDVDLHLVDSRAEQLSSVRLTPLADAVAVIGVHHMPLLPELALAALPRGTRVLVLTHDHAEDLAILDAALRTDHLGSIGVIGSSAKWTRFRAKLAEAGFPPDVIDRVETPIGYPGITTRKDPAAIAVSVAAAVLVANEGEHAPAPSVPPTSQSHLAERH